MLDDVIAWVAGDGFVYIFVIGLPLFLAVLVQQTCYGIRFLFRKFKAWRERPRKPVRQCECDRVEREIRGNEMVVTACPVHGVPFTIDCTKPRGGPSDLDALKARVEELEKRVEATESVGYVARLVREYQRLGYDDLPSGGSVPYKPR